MCGCLGLVLTSGRIGGWISHFSCCQGLLMWSRMDGKWIRGVRSWGNGAPEGGLVHGWGVFWLSRMSRKRCQSYRATGRDEECSGLLSVTRVQIRLVLICSGLFLMKAFPLNHAWLISLTFCSEIKPGNFNHGKRSQSHCLVFLWNQQLSVHCSQKKANTILGIIRSGVENKAERHHFAAIQKLGMQLWTLHLKKNVVAFKKALGWQLKLPREWSSCLVTKNWNTQDWSLWRAERRLHWGYERSLQNHKGKGQAEWTLTQLLNPLHELRNTR